MVKKKPPPRNILYADDNPINRKMMQYLLQSASFHVDLAQNGIEALKAFRAGTPTYDLIMLDVMMPGLSGEEVLLEIRKTHPDIPVIAYTSHTEKAQIIKYIRGGFNAVLVKPADRDSVARTLSKFFGDIEFTQDPKTRTPMDLTYRPESAL